MVKTNSFARRALRVGILAQAQFWDGWFARFAFGAADFASESESKHVSAAGRGRRNDPPLASQPGVHGSAFGGPRPLPPVHRTLDGASQGNLAALRTIPEPRARLLRPAILDAAPKRRAPSGAIDRSQAGVLQRRSERK